MKRDKLIIGIICVALAVWVIIADSDANTIAPAVGIIVLGTFLVATAWRK